MKKIITSAGLVAMGAAGLQAAYAPNLSSIETSKPWAISATLRGFYDDNYNTISKSSGLKRDSFGFEVSPSASINLPLDQTFIGASYTYSLRWYEDRKKNSADHSHQFNAKLDHAFSERFKIELNESFVIAQEPELLDPNSVIARPIRSEGNNIRNRASIDFIAQLTSLFGLRMGYANSIYDYEQKGTGSLSSLLDRMEHNAMIESRYQVAPQTVAKLGYRFTYTDYTSNDALSPGALVFDQFGSLIAVIPAVLPEDRNSRTHSVYLGADHNFNSKLNASANVGVQFREYVNQGHTEVGPYADASLTYAYNPGSYLQAGVRHERTSTDVLSTTYNSSGANITLDQEATALYASITHKITAKLSASLLGQFQHATFEGGGATGNSEDFYILGANLAYRFNPHLLAELGYNYDNLNSELGGRSYVRNRVYIGIRASY